MEEGKRNIFQRMGAVTQEMGTVAKNLEVGFGRGQYKAVGEADVLAAVKPLEAKHGIYSYPCAREVIDQGVLKSIDSSGKEKSQMYIRVAVTYAFVNVDDPQDRLTITSYGDGVDSQDKAPGKAMTYADKYALLKAYKIQTGDDPDQEASQPLREMNTQRTARISKEMADALKKRAEGIGVNTEALLKQYGAASFEMLNGEQFRHISAKLDKHESNGKN